MSTSVMRAEAIAELLEQPEAGKRRGRLAGMENVAITAALGALVALPLAEIILRKTIHEGIFGSNAIVQHLTLLVGTIGGAIAARENRLLTLSTLSGNLPERMKPAARVFTGAVAATIAAFLCVAAAQFVLIERPASRTLAYGVPVWMIQLALPVGFALITLRLVRHAAPSWTGRLMAVALACAMVWICAGSPLGAGHLVVPALVVLLGASVLGAPAFVTLGGVALILFWGVHEPIASIPVDHYRLVTNPSLPTIPLFTLAGYFLAEGGASRRLIRVFQALVGRMRGGPALVTTLVCAFFTSFTGGSGVTILALGGLLMPILLAAKYSEKDALGLLTGSGSLGLLFPPCLPLILYAIIAQIPIEKIFLGALGPGILMLAAATAWGASRGPKIDEARKPFEWKEARVALWAAKWELLLPVVAFVGLFGGFATPVEAAALTALYAFFIETVLYRDLKMKQDVPRVMTECGLLVGGVLLILGVALGFTNYLVDAEVTTRVVEWTTQTIRSPLAFLLVLNLFLLVVGCLMDIYSAIVIQVPLLVPLGLAYGIDPVHLGIIFLANLELGYLTPPVGLNLFMSSYRFGKPVPEVLRSVLPIIAVLSIGVLLITYVPALTTTLPRVLGK
jgi:C4-dicarboxylate transporter DctM subunit